MEVPVSGFREVKHRSSICYSHIGCVKGRLSTKWVEVKLQEKV